jgi:23S rRNA (adenine2503-C2)-methyltransferase
MGFDRNMTSGEILGQVLAGRQFLEERGEARPLRNLVFMGMGEPLLNVDNLVRALEGLTSPLGLEFSSRRITVSTVGLCTGLETLAASGLASLAISLHAPTQELRERIMPAAARATPLPELMACLDAYPLKPRQRITYEYILLRGVNDSDREARELVRLLGQRKAKVNLIVCNPGPGSPFEAPDQARVLAFERLLWDKGLAATLRKSKGQDISAACGQLRAEQNC